MNTLGTKLTKETLPSVLKSINSGKAEVIKISQLKNGENIGTWGSTLKSKSFIDDAVVRLENAANLPKDCGEMFVTLA